MEEYKLLRATGILTCLFGIFLTLFGNIRTPENFRILGDIIQTILLLNLVLLIFLPDEKTLKVALIIGVATVITDFILETVAVYYDWWYPLGGTQFPPIVIIPLEMLIGFMFIGTSVGIVLTFPEEIRKMDFKPLNWIKIFVKNPKYDWYWRFLFVFINAIIGTNGDYSAGPEIWVPGPYWHPLYTFFVWLGGGLIMLVLFYFLDKKIRQDYEK